MRKIRNPWLVGPAILGLVTVVAVAGCYNTPVDLSDFARGPAPLRMPSQARTGDGNC